MPLPASFIREGFVTGSNARTRMKLKNGRLLKPLMIGTEGETNMGKSEFILSCPGPGLVIAVDRGFDGMLDNPNPPSTRRDDFAWKVCPAPMQFTVAHEEYKRYFDNLRTEFYKALANPDALTVGMDGDSDFWELQKLAAFGKIANVWPQTKYGDVYAIRRAITARAYDSGKIVVATNKIRDEYVKVVGADGLVEKEFDGTDKTEKSGKKIRQGFPDQDYLWQIQLRHLQRPYA